MSGLQDYPEFKDRFLRVSELQIDDDCSEGSRLSFPADKDEQVSYIVTLSNNQWQKLYDCILLGSLIIYPLERGNILWSWLRSVDCYMPICDQVENCIETSEGVQNALNQYLASRGLQVVPDNNPLIFDSLLDSGCDPDIVFGQVTAVWDVINQTTIDFLEILNAATNPAEALAEAISAIPIIGQLPADELINFVDKFSEWTLDAYNAFYTTSIRNEIRCELFCLALDNEGCVLSSADLIDYFEQKVGALSQVRVQTIEDFINFIISLPTNVAILFVCGMALAQLYIVSLLERFLGFNSINSYIAFAQLGDPSDDWEGLCEDCPVFWTWDSDFLDDQNIWVPRQSGSNPEASWAVGVGWTQVNISAPPANYWRVCAIEASFDPTHIDNIEFVFNLTKGAYSSNLNAYGIFAYSGGAGGTLIASNSVLFNSASNGNGQTISLAVDDEIDYIFVFVRSSLQLSAVYSGSCKVVSLSIDGQDVNPFT